MTIWHLLQVNYRHRDLIVDLVHREFRIKYVGSLLGRYWSFLHPIALIAMYSLVFSKILQLRMGGQQFEHPWAFTLYLCGGLLPWNAFCEMLTRGVATFHDQANLVKKVNFPKEILVTIAIGSTSLPLVISLCLYMALMAFTGYGISLWFFVLPLVFFLQLVFTFGIALTLSVFNVFFRDIQQLVPIVLQLWFWATPLVYTSDRVPQAYRWILWLNPYYYFARLYQEILFFQTAPSMATWLLAGGWALLTVTTGAIVYYRLSSQLADEL